MISHADSPGWGIYCIDIEYLRPRLACSYLVIHQGKAAFIDCGTSLTVSRLLNVLRACHLEVDDVDYIIPTHIHLDHAGGAGVLMQLCPNAQLIVHPKGARHLIDPQRLIESVRQVYGDQQYQSLYGEVIAIDADRTIAADDGYVIDLKGRELRVADTPGHARHHFCIYDEISSGWFTGDSFGLSYPDIEINEGHYLMPTTTPVQFEPDAWQRSLHTLMEKNPQRMFLTHFGMVEGVAHLAEKLTADLNAYCELAAAQRDKTNRLQALEQALGEYTMNDLHALGNTQDNSLIKALLATDLKLNAQGLDIWLSRHNR